MKRVNYGVHTAGSEGVYVGIRTHHWLAEWISGRAPGVLPAPRHK